MARMIHRAILGILFCCAAGLAQELSAPSSGPTCEWMESFLREASIGAVKASAHGVTHPQRATLSGGGITHDASIQVVHESKETFRANHRTEKNFKDWWEFNVAAYRLAKLLELNMVPPYVERQINGRPASVSWWIKDAMVELDRVDKHIAPPDDEAWNRQIYVTRVFNALIYNTDPNLTNFLITKNWHLWMIDFTRSFRLDRSLPKPKELERCDRKLLAAMKRLDKPALSQTLKPYLDDEQIDALLARRDKIVKLFDGLVKSKGEGEVLFDIPQTREPCGAGLEL